MNNKSLLALSMLPIIGASGCSKADQRPNIIFFLVDDFGWTDTQVAFGPEVYEDLGEQHNVAAAHPDIVRTLANALSERLREWNAGMPLVRESGAPVEWPDQIR